jgi:hypothetical protein
LKLPGICGRIFKIRVGFDIRCLHCIDMPQNQGDVQLKKEGVKKKAKSTVTWHIIECDGSVKKKKTI